MNSRYEWTVFRETMSFYGVAHDRLPGVVTDREPAVRATVLTSLVLAEADRPIGVWCVPPVTSPAGRNRNLKRTRNPKAASIPRLLAGTRCSRVSTRPGAWSSVYSPPTQGRVKKAGKERDNQCMLS